MKEKIKIGTRSSKLALWQANFIRDKILSLYPNVKVELVEITTKGDQVLDTALSKIGDKGLFTKEIEDALINKTIDLAVHSLKDLPTSLPDGLKIGAVLNRENPCDVLIGKDKFNNLPKGAKIGTSSLRRIAQLKNIRQDLSYLDIRGNVDTRLRKLEEGEYDAIVLAYAGVKRLGLESHITEEFNPKKILPAIGQGALGIEVSTENEIEELLLEINEEKVFLATTAERSFLHTLEGGCQTPVGAYAEIKESEIILHGVVASLDGVKVIKDKLVGPLNNPKNLGVELAKKLLDLGAKKVLEDIRLSI